MVGVTTSRGRMAKRLGVCNTLLSDFSTIMCLIVFFFNLIGRNMIG